MFVVPSPPQSLEIVSFNSSSVMFQWTPPEMRNGVIRRYSFHLNETDTIDISSNVSMYTAGGLSPDTVYVLQLRAHTGAGAGLPISRTVMTSKLFNIFV